MADAQTPLHSAKVLLIDDDTRLCELVTEFFGQHHFTVSSVHAGEQGCSAAISGEYEMVILDVMLPGIDGFETLKRIRVGSDVPVIMLTACSEDVDRIVGLELGADDYLAKPFNPRELLARVRAITRRTQRAETPKQPSKLVVGELTLDMAARTVQRDSERITLTAAEFDLLALLMTSAGSVVERDHASQRVLGRNAEPFDRSIDMHISRIRKKLGPLPNGEPRIEGIRGVGYVLRWVRT